MNRLGERHVVLDLGLRVFVHDRILDRDVWAVGIQERREEVGAFVQLAPHVLDRSSLGSLCEPSDA